MENYIISLVDTENTLGKTHPTQRENGQPNFSISIQSDIVHQKKKKSDGVGGSHRHWAE